MGNCFGKPKSNNFSGTGQTLANSSAPKPVATTPTPKSVSASYSPTPAQGRTVGGGTSAAAPSSDPRAAAAMAAEERRKASQGKGKLGKQLDAQKAQTHNQVLDETSRETRLARNADANAEVRTWN